ncbi:MAG: RagB/SusD family nutrient uptake outer membrane protein, partial [Chitinophagaceae bacterium]|nr:RagB/SusD family nutrient uptake outer membrane protein [Chitinophagaceae bacterium]
MIASENVFTNNETAIAALTGLYVNMTRYVSEGGGFSGSFGVSVLAGLSSDEFSTISSSAPWSNYYTNTLGVNGSFIGSEFWSPLYNYVLKCNSVIEGLSDKAAEALTPSVRQQLFGEAKFMRAFYYFYLVNLYGDLPLAVISDYKFNSLLSRSPKAAVYQQIIADLEEAREQLSADYLAPSLLSKSEHRIRPTKWAANALLARVYLYTDNYSAAEAASSTVINNNVQFEITSLDSVFLKNSKEAIWQIQPTAVNFNTADARTFILPSSGPGTSTDWPVFLSPQLLNSFEKGDTR